MNARSPAVCQKRFRLNTAIVSTEFNPAFVVHVSSLSWTAIGLLTSDLTTLYSPLPRSPRPTRALGRLAQASIELCQGVS